MDRSRHPIAEDVTRKEGFKIPHRLTSHGKRILLIVPFCINRKAIYAVSRTKWHLFRPPRLIAAVSQTVHATKLI